MTVNLDLGGQFGIGCETGWERRRVFDCLVCQFFHDVSVPSLRFFWITKIGDLRILVFLLERKQCFIGSQIVRAGSNMFVCGSSPSVAHEPLIVSIACCLFNIIDFDQCSNDFFRVFLLEV